ncbi:MAG: DNA-binding protein [Cytophagaceae bacterium]|nr:MAG: DNA-binding protein [Cytophagaceae bacterium]
MTEFGTLWRVKDVMRYLQASRSWVYQKAEAGILPSLRVGGLLRFDPDAVRLFAQGLPAHAAQILPLKRPQRR